MVEPNGWRERILRGLTLLMASAAGIGGAAAAGSGITYHGAADRSGLYVTPKLAWANAANVHLDPNFNATVNGAVYAQPLSWVPPGGGAARSSSPPKTTRSMRSTPQPARRCGRRALGRRPLSALPCGNIDPMGVTGTPTIDRASGDRLSRSIRPDVNQRAAPPRVRPFARHRRSGAGLADRRRERTCRPRPRL